MCVCVRVRACVRACVHACALFPEDNHSTKQPDNLTIQDNPGFSVHQVNTQDNSYYSAPCEHSV